jgi:hypothetical protein
MDHFHTLTALLRHAECQYQWFDLSRRVQPIEAEKFHAIEANQQAYPWPIQQHAQLALAFWKDPKTPWIWFIKLPLDERGLLKAAPVGDFIRYVIEAMGNTLDNPTDEPQPNPYIFTPTEDKLAIYHAQLRHTLGLSPSQYYASAKAYLFDHPTSDAWQKIGLQGFADVAVRHQKTNDITKWQKALTQMPASPKFALLGIFEHLSLNKKINQILIDQLNEQNKITDLDPIIISALIRSLGGAPEMALQTALKEQLNLLHSADPDILLAMAGRSWLGLNTTENAEKFLIRLAQTGNQALFNGLFSDLVQLPHLRPLFLPLLHTQASQELIDAIKILHQHTIAHS